MPSPPVVVWLADGVEQGAQARGKGIARSFPACDVFLHGGDTYHNGTHVDFFGWGSDYDGQAFSGTYGDAWNVASDKGLFLTDRTCHVPGNHEYHTEGANASTRRADGFDEYWTETGNPYGGARTGRSYTVVDYTRTDPTATNETQAQAVAAVEAANQYAHATYIDLGGWRIVMLDCARYEDSTTFDGEGNFPTSGNYYDWVQTVCAEITDRRLIVCAHFPIYTSGSNHSEGDCVHMQPLWDLVAERAVLYMSGHNHLYERQKPRALDGSVTTQALGTVCVVDGSGGGVLNGFSGGYSSSFYNFQDKTNGGSLSMFGFTTLTLNPKTCVVQHYSCGSDGLGTATVIDSQTLTSDATLAAPPAPAAPRRKPKPKSVLEQLLGAPKRASSTAAQYPTTGQRPYRATSPYNTPIEDDPYVISESGDALGYIDNLSYNNGYWGGTGLGKLNGDFETDAGHWLTSQPDSFTFPIYYADNDTPLAFVYVNGTYREVTDEGTLVDHGSQTEQYLPIPDDALAPTDSDAQQVILQVDTGEEYSIRQLGPCLEANHDGEDGDPYYPTGTHDYDTGSNGSKYNWGWLGVAPEDYPSRGAGIPYSAMLVRPWEQANIQHMLSLAIDWPCRSYLYPASKSDGGSGCNMTPMYLHSTTADLSSGGLFNVVLGKGQGNPDGRLRVEVAGSSTLDGYAWTSDEYFYIRGVGTTQMVAAKTQLNTGTGGGDLDGNGTYTLDLFVEGTGDADIDLSFQVAKCNSAGTVGTSSAFSSEVALTGGQKRLSLTTSAIGDIVNTDTSGQDRIRVTLRFQNNSGSEGAVLIRTNTVRSMVTPPWGGWLPEGARLQLDPSISEATIRAWDWPPTYSQGSLQNDPITELAVQFALAMQTYGLIVDDQSGSKKVRAEHTMTAGWGAELTRYILGAIPCNQLRWVEPPDHSIAPWWVADSEV